MASIQGIYVALFGRPADPTGLQYFNTQTNNGSNLSLIGDLTQTAEYKARFSGMSPTEIVNSIYQSLFGRDGEKAGVDFYLGEMAAGRLTINTIAIAILDGAKGTDKTTVDAKIAAADLFTTHLDLQTEVNAYGPGNASGASYAITVGQQYLKGVTGAVPNTPEGADTAILKLFTSAGQAPAGGDDTSSGGGSPPSTDHVFLYDSNNNLKATAQTLQVFEGADGITPLRAAAHEGDTVVVTGYDNIVANVSHAVEWYANMPLGDISGLLPFDLSTFPAGGIDVAGLFTIPKPENLFLNFPSFNEAPLVYGRAAIAAETVPPVTTMHGTEQNDLMLFLDNGDRSHTAEGNGGQDIIISVSNDIAGHLPALLSGNTSYLSDLYTQGTGVHTLSGGEGNDIVISAGGNDNVLSGGNGNDVIVSLLDANDTIDGGAGNDIIFGGPDHQPLMNVRADVMPDVEISQPFPTGDIITGGTGDDTFVYSAQATLDANAHITGQGPVSQLLGNGYDTITDFKAGGDNDKIMLLMDAPEVHATFAKLAVQSTIFSHDGYSVNYDEGTAASFTEAQSKATASFQPAAIDLGIYVAAVGSDSYVFVDDNADGKSDFAIKLQGFSDLSKISIDDFTLVNTPDALNGILSFIGSTDMQKLMAPETM